jgi:hypothetical protein
MDEGSGIMLRRKLIPLKVRAVDRDSTAVLVVTVIDI